MKRIGVLLLCGVMALMSVACETSEALEERQSADVIEESEETEEAEKRSGLDGVRRTGRLVVCTSPDYAPFEFEDPSREGTDRYAGADMELARYLAEKLGAELEIRAMSFEECLETVGRNEADLGLMGMLPEEERLSKVEFTDVYYDEGGQSIVVLKERLEEFPDMESFAGKKIAAQGGTVQAQLIVEQLPESYMEVVSTASVAIPMLKNKMVDGIAVPTAVAEELINADTELAAAPEPFVYTSVGIVGCVPPDEPELKEALNDLIGEVTASGVYYEWMDEAYRLAAYLEKQ